MNFFYDLGIVFYSWAIRLAALWNNKAKQWVNGRRGIFQQIENQVEKGAIWIHAASLGEFEQGRPIIEAIKRDFPGEKILLTFFSPSGYEIRKNYTQADFIFYLPIDSRKNAKRFIALTQPSKAIFIKYEFWHHYIFELHQQQIPIYSVSALFRPSQLFFKWYGGWFRKILKRFDFVFVQNQQSLDLLHAIKIQKCSVAGDTRVDRVWDISQHAKLFPIVRAFVGDTPTIVAGSTWQPDEAILAELCKKQYPLPFQMIIAPHDINEKHIQNLVKIFPQEIDVVRYSKAKNFNVSAAEILIIDNIGILSSIYRYGHFAYIGGAFGKGLHNTLEPIAFGLPVVFGKKYKKFEEAKWLVDHQGGFSIEDYEDFEKIVQRLKDKDFHSKAAAQAFSYIENNRGATEKVLNLIMKSNE